MKPPVFAYADPRSVEEVVAILAQHGEEAKVIAGGQSLGPLLNLRLASPAALIDINHVDGLSRLGAENGRLSMGALVRQRTLERSDAVAAACPLLTEAMPFVGHVGTRNRGTVGGSAAHADPAAEIPAILTALGAELVLQSAQGLRRVTADDFYVSFLTTTMDEEELLTEVSIPLAPACTGSCWTEFALRHGDYALVGVAAVVTLDGGRTSIERARVVYAGVAETPAQLDAVTDLLSGQQPSRGLFEEAAARAAAELRPASDVLASATYKRRLARVLTRRALELASLRAQERSHAA